MSTQPHSSLECSTPAERKTFSIRNLFFFTGGFAAWFALLASIPHVAIFLSGIILAGFAALLWVRLRTTHWHRWPHFVSILVCWLAFAYLYVVSIGPAIMLTSKFQHRGDIMIVYAPVAWLYSATPLHEPLQEYAQMWGSNL